ncbi:MAG: multicopper oxidase family protein [Telluria sp.]
MNHASVRFCVGCGTPRVVGAERLLDPRSLTKYVDAVPRPAVLAPSGALHGSPYYELAVSQFRQQLHARLGPTTVWGYGHSYPGPTFEARVGRRIFVKWLNDLPGSNHLLAAAFDPDVPDAASGPPTKTVTHVHGASVRTASDGHPLAWFTRGFDRKGPAWAGPVYEYPNQQGGATLWYHDHAIGQTRLNVYAGLAGFYLLRSALELDATRAGFLPGGRHELCLAIQDRLFDVDGSLLYPVRDPAQVPTDKNHPGPWVPEMFGNVILVNGKVWPYLDVEPTRYRLRILNGSNARFYRLSLDSGEPFTQIAAEQGFFRPVQRRNILLSPGERADVIVDFSRMRGKVLLRNDARAPFPLGAAPDPDTVGQIMQFRVAGRAVRPAPPVIDLSAPHETGSIPVEELARQARITRHMGLAEFSDEAGNPIKMLLNNRAFDRRPADQLQLGSVEVWHLINTTADTHPIHLHLVSFQVLSRRPFDAARYRRDWIGSNPPGSGPQPPSPAPYYTGPALPPESNERGRKDTVQAWAGYVTTIVFTVTGFTGMYPWHCHILEHEDNDMMLQFEVVPQPAA